MSGTRAHGIDDPMIDAQSVVASDANHAPRVATRRATTAVSRADGRRVSRAALTVEQSLRDRGRGAARPADPGCRATGAEHAGGVSRRKRTK